MNQKRQFTREFKLSVLRELETKSLAEVCRANNLNPSTVCGWKRAYAGNPKESFKGHGNVWKEDAKVAQYERLVGQLYAENALLKKACESLKQYLEEEKRKGR